MLIHFLISALDRILYLHFSPLEWPHFPSLLFDILFPLLFLFLLTCIVVRLSIQYTFLVDIITLTYCQRCWTAFSCCCRSVLTTPKLRPLSFIFLIITTDNIIIWMIISSPWFIRVADWLINKIPKHAFALSLTFIPINAALSAQWRAGDGPSRPLTRPVSAEIGWRQSLKPAGFNPHRDPSQPSTSAVEPLQSQSDFSGKILKLPVGILLELFFSIQWYRNARARQRSQPWAQQCKYLVISVNGEWVTLIPFIANRWLPHASHWRYSFDWTNYLWS